MSYRSGSPGAGAVLVAPSPPLYGQNKASGMIDAGSNARRIIAFDLAVTDAVGDLAQNDILYTFADDTMLEGVVVKNIGDSKLTSGGALAIDAGGVDQTPDIQNLASGAQLVQAFSVPTERASLLVDGTNGIKCAAGLSTTIRVLAYVVDTQASYDALG